MDERLLETRLPVIGLDDGRVGTSWNSMHFTSEPAASENVAPPQPNVQSIRDTGGDTSEDSSHSSEVQQLPPKRRKPTYTVRKEEKERLEEEVNKLQAQIDYWRQRAVAGDMPAEQSLAQKQLSNGLFQDAIQHNRNQMTQVQAVMSEYNRTQDSSPIAMYLHLTTDWQERRATLARMKDRKIAMAYEYLKTRCGGLENNREFFDQQNFETESGGYCHIGVMIQQIEGAPNVKVVFDMMLYHFNNLEITLSDKGEMLTLRENDDPGETTTFQNRLTSNVGNNVQLEFNSAVFAEYKAEDVERADGGEYGIITTEHVDQDDLYPYKPESRIRRDVTTTLQLTSYKKRSRQGRAGGKGQESTVVVLKRWTHSKLHKPRTHVPYETWEHLKAHMDSIGQAMKASLQEQIHGRKM